MRIAVPSEGWFRKTLNVLLPEDERLLSILTQIVLGERSPSG